MPVKIRAMKDCIVITPQHTRELWGCLEGMSVVNINKQKVAQWLKTFPGALNDTGDVPVIKRGRGRLFKLQTSMHGHVSACPHYAKSNSIMMYLFFHSLNQHSMKFANG
jgi:hypothetical protein